MRKEQRNSSFRLFLLLSDFWAGVQTASGIRKSIAPERPPSRIWPKEGTAGVHVYPQIGYIDMKGPRFTPVGIWAGDGQSLLSAPALGSPTAIHTTLN